MHEQSDSLIVMMMIVNICHRLGLDTYYLEASNQALSISYNAEVEHP